jgi:hypothetical protein
VVKLFDASEHNDGNGRKNEKVMDDGWDGWRKRTVVGRFQFGGNFNLSEGIFSRILSPLTPYRYV